MDNIKNLISSASKSSSESSKYLKEAFKLLDNLVSKRSINDNSESTTEMCVILSESCINLNFPEISEESLKLYFSLDPPQNQFYIRAFISQAQLLKPKRDDDETSLDKPIGFLLKALNIAKKDKKYNYLVYNSSLVYYEIVRNFLRPGFYRFMCKSLQQFNKALDEINDPNMAWRGQMQLMLLQSHIDSGHKKEVNQTVDAVATFIGRHAGFLLRELLYELVTNNVCQMEKYQWYTKNFPSMQMFVRLCKLRQMKDKEGENSLSSEAKKLYVYLTGNEDSVSAETGDNKPNVPAPVNVRKLKAEQRCFLLLELAKISFQRSLYSLTRLCIDRIRQMSTEEMILILYETEFVDAELFAVEKDDTFEVISNETVKTRVAAIDKTRTAIDGVLRLSKSMKSDSNSTQQFNRLVEFGCATLWNLSLPLLQVNLIGKIHQQLVYIADLLESIQSLQFRMICQIHIEVAKGFAINEQSKNALIYFEKAKSLDKSGEYEEMIDHFTHRLIMFEKLYEQPPDPCDHARQLIEQVHSTLNSGNNKKTVDNSGNNVRPILAQIGHILAPDDFLFLLERDLAILQPDDLHNTSSMSDDVIGNIATRADRMSSWHTALDRLITYLKRSGNNNDRLRFNLWVDLVKAARKAQIWDICRVASCFVVLYDDNRWKNDFYMKLEIPTKKGAAATQSGADQTDKPVDPNESGETELSDDEEYPRIIRVKPVPSRYEKSLLELMVEVYFIRAESFIQALRNDNSQLFTYPRRPKDLKKRPKGFVRDTVKEDDAWDKLCENIRTISNMVVGCFVKAAQLTLSIQAPWLLFNAAVYLWNYSLHIIQLGEHHMLVACFQSMYECLSQLLTFKLIPILVQYGIVIIHGTIQKSMVEPCLHLPLIFEQVTNPTSPDPKAKKDKGKDSPKHKRASLAAGNPAELAAANRKALEMCQYLIDLCATTDTQQLLTQDTQLQHNIQVCSSRFVPINIEMSVQVQLINLYVQCKQLMQQPISKAMYQVDDNIESTAPTTNSTPVTTNNKSKAVVAIQMAWLPLNELYKFSDTPSIPDCLQLIENNLWPDKSMVLELLIKLTHVAMVSQTGTASLTTVTKLHEAATKYFDPNNKDNIKCSGNMLSLAFIVFCHGVALHKSNHTIHTEDLLRIVDILVDAARYAQAANNYNMVSLIGHYFWRVCNEIVARLNSSRSISQQIETVGQSFSRCVDNRRLKLLFESVSEEERLKIEDELEEKLPYEVQLTPSQKLITIEHYNKTIFPSSFLKKMSKNKLEQDIKLRIQMVLSVYDSLLEQNLYEDALRILEKSLSELPRTKDRMELFKQRILTKVKLNCNIELDIQKFKNQPDEEVSKLWREIALNSVSTEYQLIAYKNAILALKTPKSIWLKVETLIEFAQWMYNCDYSNDQIQSILEWAIDLTINVDMRRPESILQDAKFRDNAKSKTGSALSKKPGKSTRRKSPGGSSGKNVNIKEPAEQLEHMRKQDDKSSQLSNTSDSQLKDSLGVSMNTGEALQPYIGCLLISGQPIRFEEFQDVTQLASLFMCLVFLAKLTNDHSLRNKLILLASGSIEQIWKVSMGHLNAAVKEISKSKSDMETLSKNKEKKDIKKDKPATNKEQENTKSKNIKKKGALDWIPTSYEEWSTFEVPDESLEALRSVMFNPVYGIHENTLRNMARFVDFCDLLIDLLDQSGYELISFPILSLLDMISRSDGDFIPALVRNQYVHLTALKMSLKLNLSVAIHHQEEYLNGPLIVADHITYAKYLQTQSQLPSNTTTGAGAGAATRPSPKTTVLVDILSKTFSRQAIKHGHLHETWCNTASLLVQLGYNKEATDFIYQSEQLALFYKDQAVLCQLELTKLKMLAGLGEIEDAIQLADALEMTHNQYTIEQWTSFVKLLCEIALKPTNSKKFIEEIYKRICRLKLHTETRLINCKLTNQTDAIDILMANIELCIMDLDRKLYELNNQYLFNIRDNFVERIKHCESVFIANNMQQESYRLFHLKLFSVDHIEFHSDVITDVNTKTPVDSSNNENNKQIQLATRQEAIKSFMDFFNYNFENVTRIYQCAEKKMFSFPIERRIARIKILLVDNLLEMLEMKIRKSVLAIVERRRMTGIQQFIDEYVEESLPDDDPEWWREMLESARDEVIGHLSDAHSLSIGSPDIMSQVLARFGYLMYLRYQELNPNDSAQWIARDEKLEPIIDVEKSKEITVGESTTTDSKQVIKDEAEEAELEEPVITASEFQLAMKREQLVKKFKTGKTFMFQAVELLNQSVSVALSCQNMEAAMYSSEILMDIYGSYDSSMAVQYLAMMQSCQSSCRLRNLLLLCLRQASYGQLAALVLQRHNLIELSTNHELNLTQSSLYSNIMNKLNSNNNAWIITNVSTNQQDLIKTLSNTISGLCVVQYSERFDYLYCATIDTKQKPGIAAPTNKVSGSKSIDRTQIKRIKISKEQILNLIDDWNKAKQSIESAVFEIEEKSVLFEEQTRLYKSAENHNELARLENKKEEFIKSANEVLINLNQYYAVLLSSTKEHFTERFSAMFDMWKTEQPRQGSSTNKTTASTGSSKDTMVLLLDGLLNVIPMESLDFLSNNVLSRDFSVQLLYHRYKVHGSGEQDLGESGGQSTDKKKEKAPGKAPHRLQVIRDAAKKAAKVVALNRQCPSNGIAIDTHQIRYIIDPYCDSDDGFGLSINKCFTDEIESGGTNSDVVRNHQVTPKWCGIQSVDASVTLGEIELCMKDATALILTTCGDIVSMLSPQKLAMLNTSELSMFCLFDRVWSKATRRRMVKSDQNINYFDCSCRRSDITAELITLMGVKCFTVSQWFNLREWTHNNFREFMKYFSDNPKSFGTAFSIIRRKWEPSPDSEDLGNLINIGGVLKHHNLLVYGLPNIYLSG